MSPEQEQKPAWTDWLIHIIVVAIVLTGILVPMALKAAERYLEWTPPPALQNILDWLPF